MPVGQRGSEPGQTDDVGPFGGEGEDPAPGPADHQRDPILHRPRGLEPGGFDVDGHAGEADLVAREEPGHDVDHLAGFVFHDVAAGRIGQFAKFLSHLVGHGFTSL